MALEIEVETLAEGFATKQGLQHPAELGALLVDRRGIEIVDLDVGGGPHGMGQGARILRELMRLQHAHVEDALDRPGAQVGGELLVAEDGQPLLQAELEPVAAGDAVARPVVEIFVRDHAFDGAIVGVARGVGAGQHQLVVEDVEALVLHGPHIEVADRHDVEHIEIVFAAEALLVEVHGTLQGLHGPGAAVLLALLHIDAELHVAARQGGEAVGDVGEIAADESEQIRGLGKGVVPDVEMPIGAGHVASRDRVAVGEQHRRRGTRGLDAHRVDGEHVRPVEKVGDAAEAFRLALGAIGAARAIEAGQRRVGVWVAEGHRFQGEGVRRDRLDGERLLVGRIGARRERLAVKLEALKGEPLAIELQRPAGRGDLRVGPKPKLAADSGGVGVERDVEVDLLDEIVGRRVVLQQFRSAAGMIHGGKHPFRRS